MLDEIQRLVPGYQFSRMELLAGNEVHTSPRAVAQIRAQPDMILPSQDTLFTSGTLGRYSAALNSVIEARKKAPAEEVAAD
jgi:NADH-quinone oxidoreductase subunit G